MQESHTTTDLFSRLVLLIFQYSVSLLIFPLFPWVVLPDARGPLEVLVGLRSQHSKQDHLDQDSRELSQESRKQSVEVVKG